MKNINLIRKIAWSFSKSTGLEFDDLFQEAAYAYYKALAGYSEDKGRISTYMWCRITNHLNDYLKEQEDFKCRRQQVKSHREALEAKRKIFSTDEIDVDCPVSFVAFFETLTKEAQIIADLIINQPELFDSVDPEEAKQIAAELLQQKGIRMHKIWTGMKDLKLAFN
jgi:RNA polymerase sigma factor (sigma-70 family)